MIIFIKSNVKSVISDSMLVFLIAQKITFDRVTKRRRSDFCKRYNSDYKSSSDGYFWARPDKSDPCTIPKYNKSDDDDWGLRTYNFIRWASGYENTIILDDQYHESQCACALYMYYNGLSHSVSQAGKCYAPAASTGCGTSNIAYGYAHTASAISGYYWDVFTDDLGHRMWLLYQNMKTTSFCGIGASSALKTFGMEKSEKITIGDDKIPFIASPPPGPITLNLLVRDWSFKMPGLCKEPKITVKQNETEVPMVKEPYIQNWMGEFYHFVPNITRELNTSYEVKIDCGEKVYKYASYTTNCSEQISDLEFDRVVKRSSLGVYWQYGVNVVILSLFIIVVFVYVGVVLYIQSDKCKGKIHFDLNKEPSGRSSVTQTIV